MKRTFLIAALIIAFGCSTASAINLSYPYIYKSPRALGMGGAYTAIGGKADTLFYNPAGLSMMPEGNWDVHILHPGIEVGSNVLDFTGDMSDAFDTTDLNGDGEDSDDQLTAVNDVLRKYMGKNLHLRVSAEALSFARNGERLAFGFGGYADAVRLDMESHQGFGSEGVLEVNADSTFGGIGGLSYRVIDGLFLAGSVKFFHREALVHNFSARELVERQEDLGEYITDDLRKSGDAIGFDVGGIFRLQEVPLRPAVGLSVLNLGDLDFADAGKVPMTVNIGASVNPEIPVFNSLVLGVDYVDIFHGYEQDGDIPKRIRLGGELMLFDIKPASLALRTGLYQGYPTFGADLRALAFNFSYTTYAEELGGFAGQTKDRRHLFALNIGW